MADRARCWCSSCASQRRLRWPERAARELASAEASGRRSWLFRRDLTWADLPPGIEPGAPPALLEAFARGEVQLWVDRLRDRRPPGLRYLATVDRAPGAVARVLVLLHEPAPGSIQPGDLPAAWGGQGSVAPATPADLARFAPRCECATTRASLRYGPRPPTRFKRGERWRRQGPAGAPTAGQAAPAAEAPRKRQGAQSHSREPS